MSRHSSSVTLTRRSSASTVISASQYELTDTSTYQNSGVKEVSDDSANPMGKSSFFILKTLVCIQLLQCICIVVM